MMKLEIRNLQTTQTFEVGSLGITIGREGGDAEVKVADSGVSKRHAKIYARRGSWLIEDLKSANGTYVADQRIGEPMNLVVGMVFSVSRSKFEVLAMHEEPEEKTSAGTYVPPEDMADVTTSPRGPAAADLLALGASDARRGTSRSGTFSKVDAYQADPVVSLPLSEAPAPDADVASLPTQIGGILPGTEVEKTYVPDRSNGAARTNPGKLSALDKMAQRINEDTSPKIHAAAVMVPSQDADPGLIADAQPSSELDRAEEPDATDEGTDSTSAPRSELRGSGKDFMANVSRAASWYLGVVPALVRHPQQTVQQAIDESPLPNLEPVELIAYAIPVTLFSVVLGAIAGLIAQVMGGSFSIGALFPIRALLVGVIGNVIGGFIFHPLVRWLVDKLNGQSSGISRSNLFGMIQAGVAVSAVASALGVALSTLPVPFLTVLPALASVGTAALMAFVVYSWFRAFNVIEWFQYVLIGLGVLASMGACVGVVSQFAAGIRSLDRPATAVLAVSEPSVSPHRAAAVAKSDPTKPASPARPKPGDVPPATVASAPTTAPTPGTPIKTAPSAPVAAPPTAAPAPPSAAVVKASEPKSAPSPIADAVSAKAETPAAAPAPIAPFAEFKSRREKVEKTIAGNPTLLKRVAGVLPLYERLHRTTYDIDKRFAQANRRLHPSQVEVNARLKDAELYDNTSELVNQLYEKLFPNSTR